MGSIPTLILLNPQRTILKSNSRGDLPQARFWIASGLPTNRELLHSWTQARFSGLAV